MTELVAEDEREPIGGEPWLGENTGADDDATPEAHASLHLLCGGSDGIGFLSTTSVVLSWATSGAANEASASRTASNLARDSACSS